MKRVANATLFCYSGNINPKRYLIMLSKLKSMFFNFNSNRTKPHNLYTLQGDYFTEKSI